MTEKEKTMDKTKQKDPFAPSRTETAFWAGFILGGVVFTAITWGLVLLVGG